MDVTLSNIIERGGITPLFQPIVGLSTGKIYAYEALSRGPKGSALETPDRLFSHAADMRMGDKLNFFAAKTIVTAFYRRQLPGYLFLNLTPTALLSLSGPEGQAFLKECGARTKRIVIELTEQERGGNWTQIRDAVMGLRRRGFGLALDDFGEGFAGIRLFAELRPEFIKVDKHFVRAAPHDQTCRQIVASICDMARASGARVIAEGIENDMELQIVHAAGADFVQGYFVGRPETTPASQVSAIFLRAVAARAVRDKAERQNPLTDYITPTPILQANVPVYEAAEVIYRTTKPYLPVLSEKNFIGIVRTSSLLRSSPTAPVRDLTEVIPIASPDDSAQSIYASLSEQHSVVSVISPDTGDFYGLVDMRLMRDGLMLDMAGA
jgi:EAL domain-containing protein (putative c-di-GMP-specific phosphodiesterase class I)